MADNNASRVADITQLSDDDPFAELTRIMGHDPRGEARQQPADESTAEDFEIDLEEELLGDLASLEEEERPDVEDAVSRAVSQDEAAPVWQAPEPDLSDETPADRAEEAESAADAAEDPLLSDTEFDAAFEEALQDDDAQSAAPAVEQAAAAGSPDFGDDDMALVDLDFDVELDEEEEAAAAATETAPGDEPSVHDRPVETASHSSRQGETDTQAFDYTAAASDRHAFLTGQEETGEPESADAAAAPDTDAEMQAAPDDAAEDDDPFGIRAALNYATPTVAPAPSAQPSFDAPRAAEDAPPDIETVDVPGDAVAAASDFDVPDLAAEEDVPQATPLDDLEAELAGAFGALGEEEAETEPEIAPVAVAIDEERSDRMAEAADGRLAADDQPAADDRYDSYFSDAAPAAAYAGAAAGALPDEGADLAYDPHVVDEMADDPLETETRQAGRGRRGLMVAALVAGVAAIGGIGAYALSSLGGPEAPAVVQADPDPVKVKPENPGGTQVPNQDSPAYRTAEGQGADTEPTQERLVSTAEEPVNIAARSAPRVIEPENPAAAAPASTEPSSADTAGEAPLAAATPKSEERLAPSTQDTTTAAAGETLAVTPRRVKTLVVKPDGSIVERVEPAADATAGETPGAAGTPVAAAPQAGAAIRPALDNQAAAGAAGSQATAGNPADANGAQPSETEAASAGVTLPSAGPIPPSRPSAQSAATRQAPAATSQVAAATQQAAPAAPVAQNASAAAAPAPTAASGEWSVQISSQPSAEGAQASYQQLAQRYGNLLAGRGVNIVRAEIEGKGTYYRVRIPSSSKDDAIQLCSSLKSAGGSCFVSK